MEDKKVTQNYIEERIQYRFPSKNKIEIVLGDENLMKLLNHSKSCKYWKKWRRKIFVFSEQAIELEQKKKTKKQFNLLLLLTSVLNIIKCLNSIYFL